MQPPAHSLHIVVVSKRIIRMIKAVLTVNIKNFVCNIADGRINGFKSGVVVFIKVVAFFVLDNIMIGGNSLNGFVGKIIISFFFKQVHNFHGCLIEALVNQNIPLFCIVPVNNHRLIFSANTKSNIAKFKGLCKPLVSIILSARANL